MTWSMPCLKPGLSSSLLPPSSVMSGSNHELWTRSPVLSKNWQRISLRVESNAPRRTENGWSAPLERSSCLVNMRLYTVWWVYPFLSSPGMLSLV